MKKLYLLLLLSITISGNAQWIKIPSREYTTITIGIDPTASYKEKGLNLIGEFTLVSHFGYVKAGVQIFPGLTGGYFDVTGGVGLNQESAIFGIETRIYEGIHAGHNWRGATEEYKANDYPLFGIDLGVEFKLNETTSIGGRITNDWREDMKYSGAKPCWVQSGFITFTKEL